MSLGPALRAAPFVVYPLIVYFALEYVQVKFLGVALLAILLLRYRGQMHHLASGMNRSAWLALLVMVAFASAVWFSNNESLLRLYPALLNFMCLAAFAFTLFRPPSMIERFARIQRGAPLPPEAVRYTARVTWVWCAFFVLNGAFATYTAIYASRETWALHNGFIAYCLVGALIMGEWIVRRRVVARESA